MSRLAGFGDYIAGFKCQGDYGLVMHGVCAGVLEMALRLKGFEELLMGFTLEPELVCRLLNQIAEIKMAYWDMALDKFGKEVLVAVEADDLGTQDSLLISPEQYKKFLKPVHKRLFSFIKKKAPHIKVFLHCCGAIKPLIPELIDAGVRAVMVSVSADGLDASWLGRPIDRPALDELRTLARRRGMNLAGEGGEYETLVLDSPLHRRALRILESEVESGRDSGLLRVTRAMLEDKV
jgi:hypothetical protein